MGVGLEFEKWWVERERRGREVGLDFGFGGSICMESEIAKGQVRKGEKLFFCQKSNRASFINHNDIFTADCRGG